jgi:hypothetical protein
MVQAQWTRLRRASGYTDRMQSKGATLPERCGFGREGDLNRWPWLVRWAGS